MPNILTRRSFLGRAGCAGVSAVAATHAIRDLRLINSAFAADPPSDYKALVCLFMAGGNDANNWIVPTDTPTYDQYAAIRGNLALPQSSLLQLNSSGSTPYQDSDGHTVGIHYTMTSTSPETAKSTAQLLAQKGSYKHVRITRIREVAA